MVKILLIGNYWPDGQHSMLNHALSVALALSKGGVGPEIIAPQPCFGRIFSRSSRWGWASYIDKLFVFPQRLRSAVSHFADGDHLHLIDQGNAFLFAGNGISGPRLSVTCHDLIAIKTAAGHFPRRLGRLGTWLQNENAKGLRRMTRVAFVSENTRKDYFNLFGGVEKGFSVFPLPTVAFSPVSIQPSIVSKGTRFFLHAGGCAWYKNRAFAIEVMGRRPNTDSRLLVLAGPALTEAERRVVESHALEDRVIVVESPVNEELRWLYENADAFIFPSLYEGFGIPPVEAQALNCPVFASRAASLPEVLGDAAMFLDVQNLNVACEKFWTCVNDESFLSRLRNLGARNSARFTHNKLSSAYIDFFLE